MLNSGAMKRTLVVAVAVFLPSLLQARSYDAQNLKPATDNGFYLAVESSRTLPQRKFTLGLHFDYAQEPVAQVNAANVKIQNVVARELAAHLTFAYGILPWFQAGLRVSAAPFITFQPIGAAATQSRSRMSDTELNLKFRLLDHESHPIGIAVVPFVTFPTGDGGSYVGNDVVTGGGHLVIESKRIAERFSVAANVGYQTRQAVQLASGTRADDQILYGAAANFAFHPKLDAIAEIRGRTLAGDLFGSQHRPIEMEGALRIYPTDHWAITVGGGTGVLEGIGNPKFRALAGLSWIPEHKLSAAWEEARRDSDGDGVADSRDRCPSEPGPRKNHGCPQEMKVAISPEEYRILTQMIHFAFGKATLQPSAMPILETLASTLNAKPTIRRLSIQGHCDFVGTDAFNDWLSKERAESVRKFLEGHGVDPGRLETIGFGKRRPIDSMKTAAARAKNRRVEFVLVDVEGMQLPSEVPPSAQPTLPESHPVKKKK